MEARSDEAQPVQIPSEHVAVVAMFANHDAAKAAVAALLDRGFADDQISVVARGAGSDEDGNRIGATGRVGAET